MLSEAKVTEIYDMAVDFCNENDINTLFAILAYTEREPARSTSFRKQSPFKPPPTAKHPAKQSKCGFIAP